jgi:succinate dehydrogenase / fumarate reductase iron-sulfur subunit
MKGLNFHLQVWQQPDEQTEGSFVEHHLDGIDQATSFLEMLDILNERLLAQGQEPIAFDHDCREGICGSCGCVVNGVAHGKLPGTTLCQLHMRSFKNGETLVIEPFRARAMPVIKDLVVDRTGLDKIVQAGGYISVQVGAAPQANTLLLAKNKAEKAMDAAACIGCGACVAACPHSSAMLFTGAKVSHLALLPQGQPERSRRVQAMLAAMQEAGFGGCSNHGECQAVCPKEIKLDCIARLNREYLRSAVTED